MNEYTTNEPIGSTASNEPIFGKTAVFCNGTCKGESAISTCELHNIFSTGANPPPHQGSKWNNTPKEIKMKRVWAMPSAWTFTIKPIRELLDEEVRDGLWCDPYAGQNGAKYAQVTNDLAQGGIDGVEFLKTLPSGHFNGILLDPPYSLRQVSEHYKKAWIKVTGWHTSAGNTSALKDEAARVLKVGGKVICFGWNSMGLGKTRGFEMQRVLLVPHGGSKNDTIVTVEVKVNN